MVRFKDMTALETTLCLLTTIEMLEKDLNHSDDLSSEDINIILKYLESEYLKVKRVLLEEIKKDEC